LRSSRPGRRRYPEFFQAGSYLVDKDGLVDYAALLARTKKLSPGVFHEPKRDLVLFAHRLDLAIDRAGKHADYTKIFRIDGELPTRDWKRLLRDHYRGNKLPDEIGIPAVDHIRLPTRPDAQHRRVVLKRAAHERGDLIAR
jgi:hypothetical protein